MYAYMPPRSYRTSFSFQRRQLHIFEDYHCFSYFSLASTRIFWYSIKLAYVLYRNSFTCLHSWYSFGRIFSFFASRFFYRAFTLWLRVFLLPDPRLILYRYHNLWSRLVRFGRMRHLLSISGYRAWPRVLINHLALLPRNSHGGEYGLHRIIIW
jgi:hypothetical protein